MTIEDRAQKVLDTWVEVGPRMGHSEDWRLDPATNMAMIFREWIKDAIKDQVREIVDSLKASLDDPITCPECGEQNVETRRLLDTFLYGDLKDKVTLQCFTPFRRCRDCAFEFTDGEEEYIHDQTVERYEKCSRWADRMLETLKTDSVITSTDVTKRVYIALTLMEAIRQGEGYADKEVKS